MSKLMAWYLLVIGWHIRSWVTEVKDGDMAGSYLYLGAIAIVTFLLWRETVTQGSRQR